MKLDMIEYDWDLHKVAPFAGAWIEMWIDRQKQMKDEAVAPFAGAWIEIC